MPFGSRKRQERFAPHLVLIQAMSKDVGRVKLTENVSAVDALVTFEQIAEPRLTSLGEPTSAPQSEKCWKLRGWGNGDFTKCAIGTIDVGPLRPRC